MVHPCESRNPEIFANFCHPINITAQAPFEFALPLYGYVAPIITAVTVVTNSFIVAVLTRKHLKTPTNFILLAMAVAELFTGISSSPWLLYFYTFGGYKTESSEGLPRFWCQFFPYFITYVPTMVHTSAIYLTVYLALQRYFLMRKKRSKIALHLNNLPRTQWISFWICVFSVFTEIPRIITGYNDSHLASSPGENRTHRFCVHHHFSWVQNPKVKNIYYSTFYWFQAFFVHTIPCILLVILTGLLLRKLRRADRRREVLLLNLPAKNDRRTSTDLMNENYLSSGVEDAGRRPSNRPTTPNSPAKSKKPQKYFRRTTKMLVVVIAIFLLIEIPVACFFVLHVLIITARIVPSAWYQWINVCLIFRNVLILLSYPVNFAIYCGMSQQFRSTAKQVLLRRTSASGYLGFRPSTCEESGRTTLYPSRKACDI